MEISEIEGMILASYDATGLCPQHSGDGYIARPRLRNKLKPTDQLKL